MHSEIICIIIPCYFFLPFGKATGWSSSLSACAAALTEKTYLSKPSGIAILRGTAKN